MYSELVTNCGRFQNKGVIKMKVNGKVYHQDR